jgi:hypothetical protein
MDKNSNPPKISSDLPGSTDQLFRLIESKLHLLNEMRSMSMSQAECVAQHDMPALMSLLSKKQGLMESLQSVQVDLAPFNLQDPEKRVWTSTDKRQKCREMLANCDSILQQLIVMENRSLDNMVVQRELVSAQLQQNVDATVVQHAYHSGESIESRLDSSLSVEG